MVENYPCSQYPVRKLILEGNKVVEIFLYKYPVNGIAPAPFHHSVVKGANPQKAPFHHSVVKGANPQNEATLEK